MCKWNFSEKKNNMKDKLKKLVLELQNNMLTIGTIEHCTSGLLGASIFSSLKINSMYGGTIVAVDSEHMEKLLEVPENVIKKNGIISSQVACQLALCGLYKLDVDVCVATVGNVIPPSAEEEPNNIAWICVAKIGDNNVDFTYRKVEFNDTCGKNIETVINEALICLLESIDKN